MQLGGVRNEYRARVWFYAGQWHVSIETPNLVGGWYSLCLGLRYESPRGLRWLEEPDGVYELTFASEVEARSKAAELLSEHRRAHAIYEAPRVAAEAAEVVT